MGLPSPRRPFSMNEGHGARSAEDEQDEDARNPAQGLARVRNGQEYRYCDRHLTRPGFFFRPSTFQTYHQRLIHLLLFDTDSSGRFATARTTTSTSPSPSPSPSPRSGHH